MSHIVSMSHYIVGHCHSVSKMFLLASEPFNASFCWKLAISATLFSDYFNYYQICNYFTIQSTTISRYKNAIKTEHGKKMRASLIGWVGQMWLRHLLKILKYLRNIYQTIEKVMWESDWEGWSGLTGASLLTEAFHAQEFTAHHISIHTVL